jgi:hypothetical protein
MNTDKIYTEFLDVPVSDLASYIKKGWEIIQIYSASYSNTRSMSGNFMGNSIYFDMPITTYNTQVLIGRTNNARLLFERSLNETK